MFRTVSNVSVPVHRSVTITTRRPFTFSQASMALSNKLENSVTRSSLEKGSSFIPSKLNSMPMFCPQAC